MSKVFAAIKLIERFGNWDGFKFTCAGFLRHLSISLKQPA